MTSALKQRYNVQVFHSQGVFTCTRTVHGREPSFLTGLDLAQEKRAGIAHLILGNFQALLGRLDLMCMHTLIFFLYFKEGQLSMFA